MSWGENARRVALAVRREHATRNDSQFLKTTVDHATSLAFRHLAVTRETTPAALLRKMVEDTVKDFSK